MHLPRVTPLITHPMHTRGYTGHRDSSAAPHVVFPVTYQRELCRSGPRGRYDSLGYWEVFRKSSDVRHVLVGLDNSY